MYFYEHLVAFTSLQPPEQTRTRTRTAADCGFVSEHASLLGLVLLHHAQLQRAAAAAASLDVLSGQVRAVLFVLVRAYALTLSRMCMYVRVCMHT